MFYRSGEELEEDSLPNYQLTGFVEDDLLPNYQLIEYSNLVPCIKITQGELNKLWLGPTG